VWGPAQAITLSANRLVELDQFRQIHSFPSFAPPHSDIDSVSAGSVTRIEMRRQRIATAGRITMSKTRRKRPEIEQLPFDRLFRGDFSLQAEDDQAADDVLGEASHQPRQTSETTDPRPLIAQLD